MFDILIPFFTYLAVGIVFSAYYLNTKASQEAIDDYAYTSFYSRRFLENGIFTVLIFIYPFLVGHYVYVYFRWVASVAKVWLIRIKAIYIIYRAKRKVVRAINKELKRIDPETFEGQVKRTILLDQLENLKKL